MMPMTHLDQTHQSSEDGKSISIRISVTPEKADKRGSEWALIQYPEQVNVIASSCYVEICVRGRSEKKDTPNFGCIMVLKRDIATLFLKRVRAMIDDTSETYSHSHDKGESLEEKEEVEEKETEWINAEIERNAKELSALSDMLINARDEIIRSKIADR